MKSLRRPFSRLLGPLAFLLVAGCQSAPAPTVAPQSPGGSLRVLLETSNARTTQAARADVATVNLDLTFPGREDVLKTLSAQDLATDSAQVPVLFSWLPVGSASLAVSAMDVDGNLIGYATRSVSLTVWPGTTCAVTLQLDDTTRLFLSGAVTTRVGNSLSGTLDGFGAAAGLASPSDLVAVPGGDVLLSDPAAHSIRRLAPDGRVTTFVTNTSPGAAALSQPGGLALAADGRLYVADPASRVVWQVSSAGQVSAFAGSGTSGSQDGTTQARFAYPTGLALDASGSLVVADRDNNSLRRVTSNGVVSTVVLVPEAGFGSLLHPEGVAVDTDGTIWVADTGHHRICRVLANGHASLWAGTGTRGRLDGLCAQATFDTPRRLVSDGRGNLFVADTGNHLIREITSRGRVATLAGDHAGYLDALGRSALFNGPVGLLLDAQRGTLLVADPGNHRLRQLR